MLFGLSLLLAACAGAPPVAGGKLAVVASTTLIGDVLRQVGGDRIAVTTLLPVGADPHSFEPRPRDMAALADAGLVFVNGLGLEEALRPALDANVTGTVVEVSQGITPLPFNGGRAGEDGAGAHATGDPHTWTDPNNVIVWTENIAAALSDADPANAATYRANADAYSVELRALDAWVRGQTAQVPPDRRKLVTDHAVWGYFADEYGFETVGLVVAALSAGAAPSAQELARLEDAIRQQAVPAVFVGTTVNPALSEQVAGDTGAKLVTLYTDSLGEPGRGPTSYLDFMRYNVNAIVAALR